MAEGNGKGNGRVPEWLASLGITGEGQNTYLLETKRTLRRAMKARCMSPAGRVWCCLRLHTMGFQGEKAVKLEAGKLVDLTPTDVAAETGLHKQNIRRHVIELRQWGLADIKNSTKGSVELYSWADPRPVEVKNGNSRDYHFGGLPEPLKPLIPLFKRWKIKPPGEMVMSRDYQNAAIAAARDYENAQIVLTRTLKGNLASVRPNKEERNERNIERNTPAAASVDASPEPDLHLETPPPFPEPFIEHTNGNGTAAAPSRQSEVEVFADAVQGKFLKNPPTVSQCGRAFARLRSTQLPLEGFVEYLTPERMARIEHGGVLDELVEGYRAEVVKKAKAPPGCPYCHTTKPLRDGKCVACGKTPELAHVAAERRARGE